MMSMFASILGVNIGMVFSGLRKLKSFQEFKRKYGIEEKTIDSCGKRYVEPVYTIEEDEPKISLTRMMRAVVFKYNQKMVFLLGATGSGKTSVMNRFLLKNAFYSERKKKKIKCIFGMEYRNITRAIEDISDKESTILFIDGLDEIFVYRENNLDILDNFKECLLPFYKVIITMNLAFYKKYEMKFENFYHRNAEQNKIFPLKIYLKPFTREKIKKYIKKNIELSQKGKEEIFKKAIENESFYSYPLMLSFIIMLISEEKNFTSYSEILGEILKESFNWEERKYDRKSKSEKAKKDVIHIMRNISRKFLKGNFQGEEAENKFRNVLLIYNEKTRCYRFQNNVFLYYNVVFNFYKKLPRNKAIKHYIHFNDDFCRLYFEKVYNQHIHLVDDNESIFVNYLDNPVLNIWNSKILNEKWMLGLTKCFLDYPVHYGELTLKADIFNKIIKEYIFFRSLELQGLKMNEYDLTWWAELFIDKLDISNTEIKEINIPDSWKGMHTLIAENVPLRFYSFLNKLPNLKELDLSHINLQKIVDLKSVAKLPDGISADLSNCNITDFDIPGFIFDTNFKNLYMDYNKISVSDIIFSINYDYLNVSNNPLREVDDTMLNGNTVCNFYFEDEEIEKCLCKEKGFLTYDEAVKIKEIDISKMNVSSLSGLDSLPNLERIKIDTFQFPMIDGAFRYSPLQSVDVITYRLNQLVQLSGIYNVLKCLLNIEEKYKQDGDFKKTEYINYINCIENIVYVANHLIEMDYHLKENETFITGMKKLMQFINTDISVFYRRIIDAFNFAADYWKRFYNIDGKVLIGLTIYDVWKECDRLAKKDYEKKLSEVSDVLQFELLPPQKLNDSMLPYFHNIQETFSKYIKHTGKTMSEEISRQVGRQIDVTYFWE